MMDKLERKAPLEQRETLAKLVRRVTPVKMGLWEKLVRRGQRERLEPMVCLGKMVKLGQLVLQENLEQSVDQVQVGMRVNPVKLAHLVA